MRAYDLTGRKFGKLTAVRRIPNPNGTNALWLCVCECGKYVEVTSSHLLDGHTRSCGCLALEARTKPNAGQFKSKYASKLEYDASRLLIDMKRRCNNPKNHAYPDYGGRGIKIDPRWMGDPIVFAKWAVEHGWEHGFSIDRIDNDGPYSPENCRIATMQQQSNNKRNNHYVTVGDQTKTISEWERSVGCPTHYLHSLIRFHGEQAAEQYIQEHLAT